MEVLATKIERLGDDISEMRASVVKMTDAIVKFAVVEERQTHTIMAQDRITVTLDRLSLRLDAHEKSCVIQEKELRALIADTAKDLSGRIAELEKSEPMKRKLLAGDVVGACRENPRWTRGTVNGVSVVLPGLQVRRDASAELCEKGLQ